MWAVPSPISTTTPVVLPDAYNDNSALDFVKLFLLKLKNFEIKIIFTYYAGELNFSNIISVIFSLLAFGFNKYSEIKQGYSSGLTRNSL